MPKRHERALPVNVLIAYSHSDEALKDELIKHLSPLRRQGLIQDWHDRRIAPGADWNRDIDGHLSRCAIFLPLISADFINSDYCYGIEMARALERHEKGEATVIPVVLRPCVWTALPFGKLQALPRDGKPVTTWANQDEAFTDIVQGVRKAVEVLTGAERSELAPPAPVLAAGSTSAPRATFVPLVVTDSPRALIWNVQTKTVASVPVQECQWGNREASLELEPDDPTDGPFLDSLRDDLASLIVAFRNNAAICRVGEITHISKARIDRWRLALQIERSDFQPTMEVSFENTSKDELAERRARRILFNENPARDERDLNAIAFEVLLRGTNTVIAVERSVLPDLFRLYGSQPARFLEIAWIATAMRLKLSACVVEIVTLRMELEVGALGIQFHGRRRKEYTDRPAYEMKLEGVCQLV
jgi:hypothetical protein